jgi:nucleotide-binding universal stress UspA family protein
MERILVGVDGSAPSLKAVDLAADLASKYNAEIVLLTVVPQLAPVVISLAPCPVVVVRRRAP